MTSTAPTLRPSATHVEGRVGDPPRRRRDHAPRAAKTILGVCDAVTIVAAMTLAGAAASDLLVGLLSVPLWLAALAHKRLYVARCVSTRTEEATRLLRGIGWGVVASVTVAFVVDAGVERGWVVRTALLAVVLLVAEREVARRVFARRRRGGRHLRPVVVVSANGDGRALASMFLETPGLGYRVVGYVDESRTDVLRATVERVAETGATGVMVAPSGLDVPTVNTLARRLADSGVHVELSSSLRDIAARRLSVRQVGGYPVLHVAPVRRDGWRTTAKRTLDVITAIVTLALTLPLLFAAAVAIKVDSRGPVLFRQRRIGRRRAPFEVLKLRTMVSDADDRKAELRNEVRGPLFKVKADPRVTRVGRVLRKLSIDELPQLWNVLRGEMSLVGPRPALPDEMREWPAELHRRLDVKPGITGMWQVNGRSNGTFSDYMRWDLYYVDNWSLRGDLAIIARTVPVVLSGAGAY